jgi:type IV pilus assembly protein PilC
MLQTGMDLSKALALIDTERNNKILKEALIKLGQALSTGKALTKAFEETKVFPPLFIGLIQVGENTGDLEGVLLKIAHYFERSAKIKKGIQKALIYPCFVMFISLVAMGFLIVNVVPSFANLFSASGAELPSLTQVMLQIGNYLQRFGGVTLVFVLGGMYCLHCLCKGEGVKKWIDQGLLRVPVVGKLIKKRTNALFAETLAMLCGCGVNLIESMEALKPVLNHTVATNEINTAIKRLSTGHSLYEGLNGSKIYSPTLLAMIHIGEEGDILESMLTKIGEHFNEDFERTTEKIIVLIEPMLTLFIAFFIGIIVLSIILPMLHMTTHFI